MADKPTYEELEQANKTLREEIMEYRKAEGIIRVSEEKFAKAFNSSPSLITISTIADGRFVDVNHTFLKIHGRKREDVIGHTSVELGIISGPRGRERLKEAIKKTGTIRNDEMRFRIATGEERIGSFSTEIITIDGEPCMISQVNDITDLKRAQEALKRSEERYRKLFEKAPVSITLATEEGSIIAYNDIFFQWCGYTEEELKGMNIAVMYEKPEDRKKMVEILQKEGVVNNYPVQTKNKAGRKRDVLFTVIKINDPNYGELYQTISIDVTDLRRIEKEKQALENGLEHSRRMDAIASLAGGIAHKFNNALSTIVGNLELMMMELSDDDKILRYLTPLKESAYRMSNLTDQLLAYARGGKYRPQIIALNDLIRDTLPLLKHSINPSIHIKTDLPDLIPRIEADMTQMQMVLGSILSNASEAMEGAGRIRISCRKEKIDDSTKGPHDLAAGTYVRLTVEDEGRGMDEEMLSRIFEPFFSTKHYGRGLGMAAVYGIIKSHNGQIFIESAEGKGTRVDIYLPGVVTGGGDDKVLKSEPIKGTGTVLLIEDEETVMEIGQAMLEKLGYRVLKAETGREAVKTVKNLEEDIDIAILDIVLPDMNGEDLYPLLKETRPDLKVIISTGYGYDGPVRKIMDAGAEAFIQKPFSFNSLSNTLRKVHCQHGIIV